MTIARPLVRACAAAPLLSVLAGCVGPFDRSDPFDSPATAERLRSIERLDLEAASRSPAVSVDEVTDDIDDLVAPGMAAAGGTVPLTIAEARVAALASNLDLRVQLLAPGLSETSIDEEEARFESTFRASFNRSATDRPAALQTEGSQGDNTSAAVGLNVPLRSGGNIDLGLPINRNATNNPFALLNPANSADLTFSLSQPLLRNAGDRVNTHGIRVAELQYDQTESATKLETIRVLANVDRAYWRLYAAQRELDVARRQYELAQEQLERARNRVRVGADPEVEVLRAESGVAQRVEAIIVTQTNIERAERDLKRLMNRHDLPLKGTAQLELTTAPNPIGFDLDSSSLFERALDHRMEMLDLELQLAIDASTIDLERNASLPLVTLDYRYNLGGLGSTYRDALGQLGSLRFEDWSLGLRAEVPLGNEAAKARVRRALLTRIQRLASREQRRQAIEQEIYDAVDILDQNWQRILAARREAILTGRTFEGERRQFEVGVRTSTDVLDAAARHAEAQIAEIRALTDYQNAQVDLAVATGTLLGATQVRWEPMDGFADDATE